VKSRTTFITIFKRITLFIAVAETAHTSGRQRGFCSFVLPHHFFADIVYKLSRRIQLRQLLVLLESSSVSEVVSNFDMPRSNAINKIFL
jgi:hypothetical protein